MSDQYVGEIRAFAFNFPPKGWALCDGQLLPISQNQALFALLGTQFGGDGISNFALPNLQSRIALPQGQGAGLSSYTIGTMGGEEAHILRVQEIPAHRHQFAAVGVAANTTQPTQGLFALPSVAGQPQNLYGGTQVNASMAPDAITITGGNEPHENRQPFLVVLYCIALQGIFPSQN